MGEILAAIDIGTHTARLLIAKRSQPTDTLEPLIRKRRYTRLAEDFDPPGKGTLGAKAVGRALDALREFSGDIRRHGVQQVCAIATGVIREAENRDPFLLRIYEETGIRARLVSGEEEALLTGKGVLRAVSIRGTSFMGFDLGGGSTEFFSPGESGLHTRSIPLGAMVLTRGYLKGDPPKETELRALSAHIDQCLRDADLGACPDPRTRLVVGTGGTVTTLAAMIHRMAPEEVTPERVNGMTLERREIEALFHNMRGLDQDERSGLAGLDRGRADVIIAGCLVVIRILHFFEAFRLVVSLSDLLEGMLWYGLEGEDHGP
jgi:exopolyphosphatase/guanosine-5'-triphosphate,3'-diphosphate pyrophosphatase